MDQQVPDGYVSIIRALQMKFYNKAKGAGERGQLDIRRVNKAWGIVMSPETATQKFHEYGTTYHRCGCPDYVNRTAWCKHRIAFRIFYKASQELQEIVVKEIFHETS